MAHATPAVWNPFTIPFFVNILTPLSSSCYGIMRFSAQPFTLELRLVHTGPIFCLFRFFRIFCGKREVLFLGIKMEEACCIECWKIECKIPFIFRQFAYSIIFTLVIYKWCKSQSFYYYYNFLVQEGIVNISFVEHGEDISNEPTVNTPIKPQVSSYGSIAEEVSRPRSNLTSNISETVCIIVDSAINKRH
jgi:hypothetical protein